MTEAETNYETRPPERPDQSKALPCPLCGGENITSNEWQMDEDNANKFGADEWGEIWAFECMDCLAAAPIQSWNNRPDPWRYPPEMPEIDDRVLLTYRPLGGEESRPITSTYYDGYEDDSHPIVRWMPIPEIPHD